MKSTHFGILIRNLSKLSYIKYSFWPAVLVHTFNPSNSEAETRDSPWVLGQAGLNSETMSQNNKENQIKYSFKVRNSKIRKPGILLLLLLFRESFSFCLVCWFDCMFVLREGHLILQPILTWDSRWNMDWPWIHGNLFVSAFGVLGSQVHTSMPTSSTCQQVFFLFLSLSLHHASLVEKFHFHFKTFLFLTNPGNWIYF